MKIWEAVAMLQEMDQTKECTVTFSSDKKVKPFSGIPYPTHTKVVSPAYYEKIDTAQRDWAGKRDEIPVYM